VFPHSFSGHSDLQIVSRCAIVELREANNEVLFESWGSLRTSIQWNPDKITNLIMVIPLGNIVVSKLVLLEWVRPFADAAAVDDLR